MVEYDESAYLQPVPGVKFSEKLVEIDGKNRNFLSWLPESVAGNEVKGVVLMSHGLHEHALRYCNVAHAFTSAGFAFYAIDHAAHGKSDGEQGLIEDYKVLPSDFVKFAAIARSAHPPGKPTFIVCHSMGTLVVLLALQSIPDITAVVFSGCALFSGPGASSLFGLRCLFPVSQLSIAPSIAGCMAAMNPRGPAAPILIEELTTDPAELERLRRDPRVRHANIMNRTAHQLLLMVAAAKAAVPAVRAPFLALHGAADAVTLPRGSEALHAGAATPPAQRALELLPQLRHDIFHERQPDSARCVARAVDYVRGFLPAPPPPAVPAVPAAAAAAVPPPPPPA